MSKIAFTRLHLNKLAGDIVSHASVRSDLFQESVQAAVDRVLPDEPDDVRADIYARIVDQPVYTYSALMEKARTVLGTTPRLARL